MGFNFMVVQSCMCVYFTQGAVGAVADVQESLNVITADHTEDVLNSGSSLDKDESTKSGKFGYVIIQFLVPIAVTAF